MVLSGIRKVATADDAERGVLLRTAGGTFGAVLPVHIPTRTSGDIQYAPRTRTSPRSCLLYTTPLSGGASRPRTRRD